MTARPHHLRLVVANDDLVCGRAAVGRAWPVAASAHAVAVPFVDAARASLLHAAARTVLPPSPVRESSPPSTPPRGRDAAVDAEKGRGALARGLWLGTEHLGLLEELALLRRGRSFSVRGGPPHARLASAPVSGAVRVERLLRGAEEEFGPVPHGPDPAPVRSLVRGVPAPRAFAWMAVVLVVAAFLRRKVSLL